MPPTASDDDDSRVILLPDESVCNTTGAERPFIDDPLDIKTSPGISAFPV